MPFLNTPIPDLKIFEPKVFGDSRGYFYECYNYNVFKEAGINNVFVQDNQSKSSKGVLRGLHYQTGEFAQAKLVRVVSGAVLDVAVDIREGSPTYGQHFSVELSAENKRQLFVPRGFAHGFVVLSQEAEFFYKCDNFYSKAHEGGFRFDDTQLNINWRINASGLTLSEKDKNLPTFGNHLLSEVKYF